MDRFFVGEIASLGNLDGIDLADEIGDGYVRSRKLFTVALISPDPLDRQRVALRRQAPLTRPADRLERIVVDLAALDDRNPLIEKGDQPADDARLGLPALAQKDHMVPR